MTNQVNLDFLREEYFHLKSVVGEFDQRTLLIKGWSVTASLTAIGIGLKEKLDYLLLVASFSALLFWIVEALWKSFQQAYYPRIRSIEDYMRSGVSAEFYSPGILRSWSSSWKWHHFIPIMVWGHVCLPHVAIFLVGLVLWFQSP